MEKVSFSEVVFDFEKLDVYKETELATGRLFDAMGRWPARYRWLISQVSEAALSIQLNLAEGNGREGKKDRAHFFRIARGSANETVAGLSVARRLGLVPDDVRLEVRGRLYRVVLMLSGMVRGLKTSG